MERAATIDKDLCTEYYNATGHSRRARLDGWSLPLAGMLMHSSGIFLTLRDRNDTAGKGVPALPSAITSASQEGMEP